jgi:hypothetical protein
MALHLYQSIYATSAVPAGWAPVKGGTVKYPVRNAEVRRCLRELLAGKWKKVIKKGSSGDVHYFEHESGQVAGVKFLASE